MPLFQSGQILSVSPNHLAHPFTGQAARESAETAPSHSRHRYQLQTKLGTPKQEEDGQQTWRALDLDPSPGDKNTAVVLKLMAFGEGIGWQRLKLFEREMQVVQSLEHPQLPTYRSRFSFEADGNTWWGFAQEHIEGESLKAMLERGHHFSEPQLLSIATQTLAILDHLHHRQPTVLHRDVKPSNLLMNQHQRVFLVDLGAAQIHPTGVGESFTVVGTYGYVPMEQFGGRAVPASDLYALGSTLLHLLTGIAPADAPFPPSPWPDISPGFQAWLTVMIQPDPHQRYSSAREALQALRQRSSSVPQDASNLRLGHGANALQTATAEQPPAPWVSPQPQASPLIARSYPSPRNPSRPSPPMPSPSMLSPRQSADASRRLPSFLGGEPTHLQRSHPSQTIPRRDMTNHSGAALPTLAPVERPSGSQIHLERSPDLLLLELPGNDLGNVLAGFGGILLIASWLASPLFSPLAIAAILTGLWHSAPHRLRLERQPSVLVGDPGSPFNLRLILWRTVLGKRLRRQQEPETQIINLFHTLRTHDQRPDFHQPSRAFVIQTLRQEYSLRTTLSPAESAWLMQELQHWLNKP